jgi:ribosomal protein L19E
VLKCGKRKVWMDPNEIAEIANANSRESISVFHWHVLFFIVTCF